MLIRPRNHSSLMDAHGLGELSMSWPGTDPPRWWAEHQAWRRAQYSRSRPTLQVIQGGLSTAAEPVEEAEPEVQVPAPEPEVTRVLAAEFVEGIYPSAVERSLPADSYTEHLYRLPSDIPHLRLRAYPTREAAVLLPDGAGGPDPVRFLLPVSTWTELPRITTTTELVVVGSGGMLTLVAELR